MIQHAWYHSPNHMMCPGMTAPGNASDISHPHRACMRQCAVCVHVTRSEQTNGSEAK